MTNALVIAFGFVLLIVQGMVQHIADRVAGQWAYPSLVLPIVLFMAVGTFSLARGAALSFVLGYLTDAVSGLPMGMFTFTMVAVFLLARVVGLKLFLHGVVFQIVLTLLAGLTSAVLILGMHVIFERNALAMGSALLVSASQATVTALFSPVIFAIVRRIPGAETPRPEEA